MSEGGTLPVGGMGHPTIGTVEAEGLRCGEGRGLGMKVGVLSLILSRGTSRGVCREEEKARGAGKGDTMEGTAGAWCRGVDQK